MAIGDDFQIATNGDIRIDAGDAGVDNYTVIAFHRWLGDLMDNALASGDDLLDITDATASERSTDNIITLKPPYNINDAVAQRLYDGSIVQGTGITEEIYEGILVFANAGMRLEIVQNGALATPNFWTTGLNADAANGISHRFMLKVRTAGADIDGRRLIGQTREFNFTYSEFKINGTSRGNNVLALTYASDLNNQNSEATVSGWTTITNTTEGYNGINVDGDVSYYYSQWNVDKPTRTINNFYERMKWLTRRGTTSTLYGGATPINGELFRGITHEIVVTAVGGTFNSDEPVSWPGGTGQMLAINSPAAATKMWIQITTGVAPTNTQTITGGDSGGTVTVNTTVTERTLSFPFIGQSTGSAIIGAYGVGIEIADLTSSDKLTDLDNVLQVPPNNVTFTVAGLITGASGDRVLVAPLGYEFAYDNEAVAQFTRGDSLTFGSPVGTGYLSALRDDGTTGRMQIRFLTGELPTDNTTITNGTATALVNGAVVASEDPRQLKLATTLNGVTTSVVCTATIPTDTPTTGTIRIQMNTGIFRNIAYTSYNSGTFTFTIGSTDFTSDPATGGAGEAGNSIFIAYIDKQAATASESFTSVYLADRSLFIRVRNGTALPIKTFETTGTLGSAGGSSTAIRTTDL